MSDQARRAPRSVPDPEKADYDAMIVRQRALNAAQEREQEANRADSYASTANQADDVLTAFGLTPAIVSALAGDNDAFRAAKSIQKVTGPAGHVLSIGAAKAGYKADRLRGMPKDEAVIRHGGGLALGALLGAAGAYAGGALGARGGHRGALAGSGLFGYMGAWDGKEIARQTADAWHDAKAFSAQVSRTIGRNLATLNDPRYWANRTGRFRGE